MVQRPQVHLQGINMSFSSKEEEEAQDRYARIHSPGLDVVPLITASILVLQGARQESLLLGDNGVVRRWLAPLQRAASALG